MNRCTRSSSDSFGAAAAVAAIAGSGSLSERNSYASRSDDPVTDRIALTSRSRFAGSSALRLRNDDDSGHASVSPSSDERGGRAVVERRGQHRRALAQLLDDRGHDSPKRASESSRLGGGRGDVRVDRRGRGDGGRGIVLGRELVRDGGRGTSSAACCASPAVACPAPGSVADDLDRLPVDAAP